MKMNVADALEREGEVFTAEYDAALPDIDYMGDSYRFDGDVHVQVSYWSGGENITVHGHFAAAIPVVCSRCLKEILYPVDFSFTEHYKENPEDGEYPYTGEEIDLDRMLGDNVVMNLPESFCAARTARDFAVYADTILTAALAAAARRSINRIRSTAYQNCTMTRRCD